MKTIKRIAGAHFDPANIFNNIMLFLVALLLIAACFSVSVKEIGRVEYDPIRISSADIYVKQFDAFMKGQTELDVAVDPRLSGLENPYDPAARKESGAKYYWDYAFYEGKYYSYFGIAPILTVYFPIYALTGELPNIPLACMILAIASVIFTALAYREVVCRFCKKPNFWLFLLGFAGVICASGVYLGVLCSDMYYVAVLSAQAFSMLFVFLSVRAMREERLWVRMILLVLAAISLVLTVWSRPTVALMCVAVFPLFIEFIFKIRRETLKDGLLTAASFALPLVAGAIAVMWYNNARFSSPFDFGANYQLTVSDISKNTIDFAYLFSALFSYFLCPMWKSEAFPYIEMQRKTMLPNGARYIYADRAIGAFAFGLPLGILAYPRLALIEKYRGEKDTAKSAVVAVSAILALGIAFSDFCLGGVNMRYVYDISVILSLVSAATLLSLIDKTEKQGKLISAALAAILFAISIYVNIGVVTTIGSL